MQKPGKKDKTLCYLIKKDRNGKITHICMGMKTRGLGEGRWNGAGGKVGDRPEIADETVREACVREVKEEFGVIITEFKKAGMLEFQIEGEQEIVDGHVFVATKWKGKLTDSEEMNKVHWFQVDEIPYDKMWVTDAHWLPYLIEGKYFEASYIFIDEGTLAKKSIKVREDCDS
ncbi:NUDIX domain-containing protein [Candidatus Dojkabacteria bacterium]|nr:NUDIX domain-containing protein [Candidatus Dojkabacteria bacterium]